MLVGAIAYLILAVISYKYKKERAIKFANYVVILLVIANIFVISASLYYPRGKGYVKEFIENGTVEEKCSTVNGKIKNFKEAIEYIKENDADFYRIAKKELAYENLSIIYDYNPIQLYLSLGNQSVYNLSCDLEDNCYTSTRCVNGADRRTKYMTLLANKYYICETKDSRYVPYGYILYHKIGDTQIYLNENYLSVGMVYDSYITEKQFEQLSPLEKEDSLITTAMIESFEGIEIENNDVKINSPVGLEYTVKNNKILNNTINITEEKESIELTIDNIPSNTELYLSIDNLQHISKDKKTDFKITAKIDGISDSESVSDYTSSAYYMNNPNFLMNLGTTEQNQDNTLKLIFNKKGTYTFDSFEILAVNMDKYEEKIDNLKTNAMQDVEYGNNYVSGIVNTSKNGILQITTSYSDGWKAYVDEKEVEVLKVNGAFIGINLEAGEHTVRFEYETPYLKLGMILSIIGSILFLFLIVMEQKRV